MGQWKWQRTMAGIVVIAVLGFAWYSLSTGPVTETAGDSTSLDQIATDVTDLQARFNDLEIQVSTLTEEQMQDAQMQDQQTQDEQTPADEEDEGEPGAEGTSASAEEAVPTWATVDAEYLNVRREPSTDAPVIGVLRSSATVSVMSQQDSWTQVEYTFDDQTYTGWVHNDFITTGE